MLLIRGVAGYDQSRFLVSLGMTAVLFIIPREAKRRGTLLNMNTLSSRQSEATRDLF